jgi:DNA-binding MarR family transcriptional regulator
VPIETTAHPTAGTREDIGFLLAKASQRWNELLAERFGERGYPEVRPAYGSLLVPLFEEDGLRMGELARRARLSKQTMTTMVRLLERDGLATREPDPYDGRAFRVLLSPRAREFEPVARQVLRELHEELEQRLGRRNQTALRRALKEVMQL